MIRIGRPCLRQADGTVRLCAVIERDSRRETMWFAVAQRYGGCLVDDRADAFVTALLPAALRAGEDITCAAPVSRRLLYRLRHALIPMLAANLPGHRAITLRAEPCDAPLPCAGAAATGWTGGVDSLFTLMKTHDAPQPGHRLTHLMIANNGALEGTDRSGLLRQLVHKAEQGVAAELGLTVVGIDSNLPDLLPEPFLAAAAYRQAAVILALQKLFGVYYSSAAYEFSRFAFDPDNCFYFESLLFDSFCTNTTAFYAAYGAWSRAQKLRELAEYPLAWRELHPCIRALPRRNCGCCGKCVRTMAALYGLGTLERFAPVFDVDAFLQNRDRYIADVLAHKESQHYGEALALLRRRGIEPSPAAVRMARTMRAAAAVAAKHRPQMTGEENDGDAFGHHPGVSGGVSGAGGGLGAGAELAGPAGDPHRG